ncbi:MBL fold metallo-hydrolase [Myxococcota bacterium]|nr:MBL fold metallo-hydrolase [Myxococcota bacterium]MBU1536843.1 MBL fold metallo-hydrolase [Myxococcota bacterium]
MRVTFYGARGSYPLSDANQRQFGGHTTCFHVECPEGEHIIIDAGTGIRALGKKLMQGEFGRGEGVAHMFFTHTHWDHILGLPFFDPLFIRGNVFHLHTAKLPYANIQGIFNGLFNPDIFPVPFNELDSQIELTEHKPPGMLRIGSATVSYMQINHNNVTLGFRVNAGSHSVTILSDNAIIELARMGDGFTRKYAADPEGFVAQYRQAQMEFAMGTDILVCDTHFSKETIKGREHWGHSTPDEAIRLAHDCSPKYLILHHHDPELPDSEVIAKEQYVQEALTGSAVTAMAPYPGLTIELGEN